MASQLEENLLVGSTFSDFGMTAKELSILFTPENVRDGSSLVQLGRHGKIEGLMMKLRTDPKKGLDSSNINDMELRVKKQDILKQKSQRHFWNMQIYELMDQILENFEDPMLRILCLAAAVNLIIGVWTEGWKEGWMDGMAIFIAVIIIVSVTAGNNYVKDQQFRKLNAIAENRNVNVKRGGKIVSTNIYELVVGDIMIVDTGEKLPVDGVVIESSDLKADESSITGETNPIKKNVPVIYEQQDKANPFLISGSSIIEGTGEILILAVGENSQWGISKKLMTQQTKDDKTPLQEKLGILADQIGEYGLKAAVITFIAMTLHLLYDAVFNEYPLFSAHAVKEILNFFIVSVTIIVVAVPEGLPLAVTIALAYSVGKMKDEKNLVRFLSACETMGGANNICSDKTGTLTENKMTVTNLYVEDTDFSKLDPKAIKNSTLELLCEGICLNSMAHPQIDESGKFEHIGNKTECALLEMCYKFGYDFRQIRQNMGEKIKKKFPFSSEKKKMTIILDPKGDKTQFKIYTKGAPDMLLDKCSHYINAEGKATVITNDYKQKINSIIKNYASQSLRSILLLYRETMIQGRPQKPEEFNNVEDLIDKSYTIIGVTGLQDPLKEGIIKAVQQCKEAGVTVRMVTGDNFDTAVAISKKAGILPPNYEHHEDSLAVMEGKTFRQMVEGLEYEKDEKGNEIPKVKNLQNFTTIAQELKVLARSSPEDKFLLVTGLKQLENVVAVTGDGTNDAPALKKADVGFAMGIQGTEVAKEAAGIILLDDNFASIVTAMKWGRNIFDCIRKFLVFQVTVNVVAVTMAFLGGVFLKESPLTSIQMLWVNLIMDTLASLALATEPPTDELLTRKPYGRKEHMITPGMWRSIICQAAFQLFVLLIILFRGDSIFGIESSRGHRLDEEYNPVYQEHYTIFFHIFVFLQVFNEINARKLKKTELNVFDGFFNNYLFIGVIVGTIVVQILIVQLGGKAIKVTPLDFGHHVACIIIGMCSLGVGYCIKQIPDQYFQSIELFKEQVAPEANPETIQGKMKRPSTFLRKKRAIENKQPLKGSQEIELKAGTSGFKQ
uniref:Calcium-transporting ATPase n=1 Tax=Paramecium tetraurelia TaxID=5888 RepID=Q3SEF4_PARTE|nr:PMCA20 [Paramecium tetraurelia]